MSQGSDSESFRGGAVLLPLLLECDLKGQLVWVSERARSAIGEAHALGPALAALVAALSPPPEPVDCLRICLVLETANTLVIGAQPEPAAAPETRGGLVVLQARLLRHYFRLERVERLLSAHVKMVRRGGGSNAVRQLELERQRLGRELHTGVGQLLAAIRLQLEVVSVQIPEPPAAARDALGRISTLAAEALEQVRSISRRLHPPEWQRLSLESAIQQLWDLSGVPERFDASLLIERLPVEPALEIKVLFYRAAQEALSNLVRHARASRIQMALEPVAEGVRLTIRDNGVGFDPAALFSAPASVASGIGLRSIREQAFAVGGKMNVESGPSGTTLEVIAPHAPMES